MASIDLSGMLKEIIDEYGKNEDYAIPTISWSKNNMLSRYGEYQYWHNHISLFELGGGRYEYKWKCQYIRYA